jgi:Ankyrin repeat
MRCAHQLLCSAIYDNLCSVIAQHALHASLKCTLLSGYAVLLTVVLVQANFATTALLLILLLLLLSSMLLPPTGDTSLLLASEAGSVAMVQLLLEHGADQELPGMDSWLPLQAAAAHDWVRSVRALLKYDKGTLCSTEAAALATAALSTGPGPRCTALLLRAGACVHGTDSEGCTCLHAAVRNSCCAGTVKQLLRAGADAKARNAAGLTAAELARDAGNVKLQRLLSRAANC